MQKTIDFIEKITDGFYPELGIILGSGLGDFADGLDSVNIKYSDIPGFQASKVEGHKGQLVFANLEGKNAVIMQGRYHFYEGYPLTSVVYPIKVMRLLGVKNLIVTNAAGALHKGLTPGDLMLIKDHINFMGENPLRGENDSSLGVRFPDMSEIYKKNLRLIAKEKAQSLGLKIKEGVYAAVSGPSYETPAEIKMLGIMGADAVGMSTAPEAIVAAYCSINVLGISCITNYAAGVSDSTLSHNEVIETADRVKDDFKKLLIEIIKAV